MNSSARFPARSLITAAIAATLIAGCASAPTQPAGSAQVRARLTALQGEPTLANRAPVALKDAEAAVVMAEVPQKDPVLAAHRVYVADRKVETARALAERQYSESQRIALNEQSEKARLDSRTREADRAKSEALDARNAADAAQIEVTASRQQSAELQRQLEILQARPTDRGLVLTLGDTLFATGRSELKPGATVNLDRITTFLNQYPRRTAAIEGFTDSMGSDEMNQSLSERRADAVKNYLVGQGIASARLTSSGRGESSPVADNASAAGRQQNRRVEVVISQIEAEVTRN